MPAVPAEVGRVDHHTPAPGPQPLARRGRVPGPGHVRMGGCSPRTAGPACWVGRARLVLPHLVRRGVGNRGADRSRCHDHRPHRADRFSRAHDCGARRSTELTA